MSDRQEQIRKLAEWIGYIDQPLDEGKGWMLRPKKPFDPFEKLEHAWWLVEHLVGTYNPQFFRVERWNNGTGWFYQFYYNMDDQHSLELLKEQDEPGNTPQEAICNAVLKLIEEEGRE